MAAIRLLTASLAFSALAFSQGASAVEDAAKRFTEQSTKVPGDLRIDFQLSAAQALAPKYPAISRKLLDPVLAEIRADKIQKLSYDAMRSLAAASPQDAIAVVGHLTPGSREMLINAFTFAHRTPDAMRVLRDSLASGQLPLQPAAQILKQLAREDPAQAKSLFEQVLSGLPAHQDPMELWQFIACADAVRTIEPKLAADAYGQILAAAAKPEYGAGKTSIIVTFANFDTHNSRDTILVSAGSRLLALDPTKAAPFKDQLSHWDLSKPLVPKGMTFANAGAKPNAMLPEIAALHKQSGDLRGNLTDAERSQLAVEQARRIDALLAGQDKLNLARGLASLSTEGDLGKPALTAVAGALAHALHENPGTTGDYVELASLIRYEGVPAPAFEDPAEQAAEALLALRDQIHQSAGFTLTGLDGKTWSLAALRGKIVLLNFWATWCPPCRKEMPDMEKLSRTYADQGLVVLAVSDEDRDTVAPFIAKQGYTFPVVLDTDEKVHGDFDVTGIPKSFIFDREGRMAAQAIDMRTMSQFLELLKKAGLEPASSY